jgi:lysozyme
MVFNLKFIFITMILLIFQISTNVFNNNENKQENEQKGKKLRKLDYYEIFPNPSNEWHKNYEKTIQAIKKHEGFARGKPYICPGGYATIGYGHLLREGENITQLTEIQADSLLRIDFNKALIEVESSVNLKGTKKLAIAHFVFTRGIGAFNKSELREQILKDKNIDNEIVKWCYYTNKNKQRIKSQHALNIRKWELRMYKLDS